MHVRNLMAGLAGVTLLCAGSGVQAAVVQQRVSSGTDTQYDSEISSTDLINMGQPTLSGSPSSSVAPYGSYAVTGLNNGSANTSDSSTFAFWSSPGSNPVVTVNLDTSDNQGYDIQSMTSIAGWSSAAYRYAAQQYDVHYSVVGDPNFTPLTSVDYVPFTSTGAGASKVTISDTTGTLATNVDALRFTFYLIENETAVWREIDVTGIATVPEPGSAVALLSLGTVALLARRRFSKLS